MRLAIIYLTLGCVSTDQELFLPTFPALKYKLSDHPFSLNFKLPDEADLSTSNLNLTYEALTVSILKLKDELPAFYKTLVATHISELKLKLVAISKLSNFPFPRSIEFKINPPVKTCEIDFVRSAYKSAANSTVDFLSLVKSSNLTLKSLDLSTALSSLYIEISEILDRLSALVEFAYALNVKQLSVINLDRLLRGKCEIIDFTKMTLFPTSNGQCFKEGESELTCQGTLTTAHSPETIYRTYNVPQKSLTINLTNIFIQNGKLVQLFCEWEKGDKIYNCSVNRNSTCLDAINGDNVTNINAFCPIVKSPNDIEPIPLLRSTLIQSRTQVNNLPSKYHNLTLPPPPFVLMNFDPLDMGKKYPGYLDNKDTVRGLKPYDLILTDTTLDDIENLIIEYHELIGMILGLMTFIFLGFVLHVISKRKGTPRKFEHYVRTYLPMRTPHRR